MEGGAVRQGGPPVEPHLPPVAPRAGRDGRGALRRALRLDVLLLVALGAADGAVRRVIHDHGARRVCFNLHPYPQTPDPEP